MDQSSTNSAPWFKLLWLDTETTSPFHLWNHFWNHGLVEIEMQLSWQTVYSAHRGHTDSWQVSHSVPSSFLSLLSLYWHWISNKQTGLLSRSLILTPCFNQCKETPQSILHLCPSPCFFHLFFNYPAVWDWRLLWRKSFLTLWTSGVGLVWSYFVQRCPQSHWYVCLWRH